MSGNINYWEKTYSGGEVLTLPDNMEMVCVGSTWDCLTGKSMTSRQAKIFSSTGTFKREMPTWWLEATWPDYESLVGAGYSIEREDIYSWQRNEFKLYFVGSDRSKEVMVQREVPEGSKKLKIKKRVTYDFNFKDELPEDQQKVLAIKEKLQEAEDLVVSLKGQLASHK